jgi:mono/diheme cytochrome c family protein
MKRYFLAAALTAAVSTAAVLAFATDAQAGNPIAGKRIYDANCVLCHGVDGQPRAPGTPNFVRRERMEFPDTKLMTSLRNSKNLCPSWRSTLTDMDLSDVITYIRTLGR